MKKWPTYRRKYGNIRALHFTHDVTIADLKDFCDGLVIADKTRGFKVYDESCHEWLRFDDGDWIVDDHGGLHPMNHDTFMAHYEQETDAPPEP